MVVNPDCTTRDEIEVNFINGGSTYGPVKRYPSTNPMYYHYPTAASICFDKVEVKATGSDAAWIDYMQIQDGRRGKPLFEYGSPGSSGFCLSTDTKDTFYGGKCYKKLFVYPDGYVRTW
mmetsp:Transcript_26999/g.75314  ORF Transcript_26999/g.75314 Transcript_26999/m.75314 type:complete len:119 (+) Transcript_26999:121-477(+)